MGGHAAGEVASGMTIGSIGERFGSGEVAVDSSEMRKAKGDGAHPANRKKERPVLEIR